MELARVAQEIIKNKAKRVCIQLPAGLKKHAKKIQKYLEEKTGVEITIWASSCFGACDVPNLENTEIDMLIQFGHSKLK